LRLHPLVVQSGPYLIGGYLHARPDAQPLDETQERPAMTPLSRGWLEYWTDGVRRDYWVGTIIFNRALADAVEIVPEEALEFGATEYPIRAGATGMGDLGLPTSGAAHDRR
jgi:hypothetical protein